MLCTGADNYKTNPWAVCWTGAAHCPPLEENMKHNIDYIRTTYNVPAKVGGKVEFRGKPGTIVGTIRAYLRIRLDGETEVKSYHPTLRQQKKSHDHRMKLSPITTPRRGISREHKAKKKGNRALRPIRDNSNRVLSAPWRALL